MRAAACLNVYTACQHMQMHWRFQVPCSSCHTFSFPNTAWPQVRCSTSTPCATWEGADCVYGATGILDLLFSLSSAYIIFFQPTQQPASLYPTSSIAALTVYAFLLTKPSWSLPFRLASCLSPPDGFSPNWKLCYSPACNSDPPPSPGNSAHRPNVPRTQTPPYTRRLSQSYVLTDTATCSGQSTLAPLSDVGGSAFLEALTLRLNILRDKLLNAPCAGSGGEDLGDLVSVWYVTSIKLSRRTTGVDVGSEWGYTSVLYLSSSKG